MTPDYEAMIDEAAAKIISTRVSQWDKEEPLRYATLGLMALAVEKRLLWRLVTNPEDGMPCRSFATWVRVHAPRGYSTVYAALKDVEELSDVPADDLAQIPQSNMRTMKQLSSAVRRDPKVLELAKTQKTDALVAYVKAKHPNQHVMAETVFRCPLNELQMTEVEAAIIKAMNTGCASRSEALWMIAVDYLSNDVPLEEMDERKFGHA